MYMILTRMCAEWERITCLRKENWIKKKFTKYASSTVKMAGEQYIVGSL